MTDHNTAGRHFALLPPHVADRNEIASLRAQLASEQALRQADGVVMRIGSCFSGVAAMDRGVSAFFKDSSTAWFIEREPYPCKVLARHYPGVPIYEDITTINPADLEPVDIMVGGPPCTDLSVAGKGAGLHGEKSRLFFDMVNIAKVLRPRYVMIENSPVLLNNWRGTVEGALADAGYGVTWARLSAAHVGAPHLRWRCFLLAELGGSHKGVCFPPALPSLERWPTPAASLFNDNEDVAEYMARRARVKESAGSGSGFGIQLPIAVRLPSPAASDVMGSRTLPPGTSATGIKPNGKKAQVGLPNAVETRRWPTPTTSEATIGSGAGEDDRNSPGLASLARWATPQASDTKDRGTMGRTPAIARRVAIGKQITLSMETDGARLSPDWVETLQGLPVNWTALEGDLDPRPWPAHRVEGMWGDSPQLPHEPPRLCDPKEVPNRRARLKALGNLNPPQVYTMALKMLMDGPRQGMLFD